MLLELSSCVSQGSLKEQNYDNERRGQRGRRWRSRRRKRRRRRWRSSSRRRRRRIY